MTPETAKQQVMAALSEAGLDGQVEGVQSAAFRDRFERSGHVIWDEPAIRVWMTISDKDDELARNVQDAFWTLDGIARSGYDGQSLISVIWWLEDDQER